MHHGEDDNDCDMPLEPQNEARTPARLKMLSAIRRACLLDMFSRHLAGLRVTRVTMKLVLQLLVAGAALAGVGVGVGGVGGVEGAGAGGAGGVGGVGGAGAGGAGGVGVGGVGGEGGVGGVEDWQDWQDWEDWEDWED